MAFMLEVESSTDDAFSSVTPQQSCEVSTPIKKHKPMDAYKLDELSSNSVVIWTHHNVDLDAVASCWAYETFVLIPQNKRPVFKFCSAAWDGEGMGEHDVALDVYAGGRGIKGEHSIDGHVHSCFKTIVELYAQEQDRLAIMPIITMIDTQDTFGSVYQHLLARRVDLETRKVFDRTGLNAVLSALRSQYRGDDLELVNQMRTILSGMLSNGRSYLEAKKEASNVEILPGGRVAILNNASRGVYRVLFEDYNIDAVVYVDGFNMGVIRSNRIAHIRMDDEVIRDVVRKAGEYTRSEGGSNFWYPHPSGFLFAHGTYKAPSSEPSKVDPKELAMVVDALIKKSNKRGL